MEVIDCGSFSLNGEAKEPVAQQDKPKVMQAPPGVKQRKEEVKVVRTEMKKMVEHKTPDGIKEHQEHILMLTRYGASERFGAYLKSIAFDLRIASLKKKSLPDLQELLERVRASVGNKTVSDVWTDSIVGGICLGENIVESTTLGSTIHIKGLSEVLKDDETFMDLLEELRLENQNLAYVSPYTRLVYSILVAGAKVHGLNSVMLKRALKQEAIDNPIQPTVETPIPIQEPQAPTKVEERKTITTKPKQKDNIIVLD